MLVRFSKADAWIEMTGAKRYKPFLRIERAELARVARDDAARQCELREAHRLLARPAVSGSPCVRVLFGVRPADREARVGQASCVSFQWRTSSRLPAKSTLAARALLVLRIRTKSKEADDHQT